MKQFIETEKYHPLTENPPTFRSCYGFSKTFSFRVTCKRGGTKEAHSFSSMDAARVFGSQLNNIFGWKADMKNYDIEVILNIWKDGVSPSS